MKLLGYAFLALVIGLLWWIDERINSTETHE